MSYKWIILPYGPATPSLGMYLEKIIIPKDTCTLVLMVALFTIARIWKQLKCPLVEEWIRKIYIYVCVCVCVCVCVYIYMEYYLAIKRNKTMPIAEMWVNLETIMQT